MKKIILTAGPIPARFDSVKFITNRFKGGLAIKTANKLKELGNNVLVVCWKYSGIKTNLPTIYVEDVIDYYNTILRLEADAYILAAAVANLMPSEPFKGKFPSHIYKIGDRFNINFEISPRVIDQIKKKYPRATLIGYKLYDGTEQELIKAGRKTLFESKANLIFANHPSWAKQKKIALTNDGAVFDVSFDQHIDLMHRLINERWYRTEIIPSQEIELTAEDQFIIDNYPKYILDEFVFGTFAIHKGDGFITTTRGKKEGEKSIAFIQEVDHITRVVRSNIKATLNAPLLNKIFELNPGINYIIHGHAPGGDIYHNQYEFPGTVGDLNNAVIGMKPQFIIGLKHHGYIACFQTFDACKEFVHFMRNPVE